jgi:DNA invertase Pin-like site-specific DNA recombinase
MRAIGYITTTPDTTLNEDAQFQGQYRAITAYCKINDHNLTEVFSDSLEQGKIGEGYSKLLEFIDIPNQASLVIVTGSDQLGSSLEEAVDTILRIDRAGSTVTCSDIDYPDPLQNALNFFRQIRSHKIRGAMLQKALEGKALGRPAYGYQISELGTLVPDPAESDTVKAMFEMYLKETTGIRRIANSLNDNKRLNRNGAQWTIAQILAILRNPTYIGTYRRFGLRIPNNHESIISAGHFTSTQQLMRSRRVYKSKRQSQIYPLSGILLCVHCNKKMIGFSRRQTWKRKDGSRNQKIYRYYYCPHRLENPLCQSNVTGAAQWEKITAMGLFEYLVENPEQRVVSKRPQELHPSEPSQQGSDITALQGNLRRRWMTALKLTASGSLTLGDLRRITDELEYLNSGIDEQEHALLKQLLQVEDIEPWHAMSLWEQKVLFTSFIDSVVLEPPQTKVYLSNGDKVTSSNQPM